LDQIVLARACSLLLTLCVVTTAHATTYTVTSSADVYPGNAANCPGSSCTLRDATVAASGIGDVIVFDPSVTLITMTPAGGANPLSLGPGVTIDGHGLVTVDGSGKYGFVASASSSTTINGLTVRNTGTAINNAGTFTLTNSTLSSNYAVAFASGGGVSGGGIYNTGMMAVTNCILSGNSANGSGSPPFDIGQGGGIYNAGTLTVTNGTLSGNSATGTNVGRGGGIYNIGTLTVTNSTLSGNSADFGGGIRNMDTLTVINSTLSGNSATIYGGGIHSGHSGSPSGSLTLINSTLSGNSALNFGGSIYILYGTLATTNSILDQGSGSGTACYNAALPITDNDGNIDSDGSCGLGANSQSNVGSAAINLGPLADNGGPTQTMLPGTGSVAINAIACTNAPPFDQRDYWRPDPASIGLPTPCDVGAVEAGSQLSDRLFADGFGQ
jgi:hypothetical protein